MHNRLSVYNAAVMWFADMFETSYGWAVVVHNNSRYVKNLLLPTDKSKAESLLAEFPQKPFPLIESKLRKYFAGKRVDFSMVEVFLERGRPFYKRVYEELRKVPYGSVVSYSWLAEKAGKPRAVQAVGGAMKHNRVPLIVPCHRVIKKDGKLGGFSANSGPEMKRKMLSLEAL